jgi:hypothetical protein
MFFFTKKGNYDKNHTKKKKMVCMAWVLEKILT